MAMYRGSQRGWVEIIVGVMFSGKSEELIRRVPRAVIPRQHVQVFKSHFDDRYGGVYAISTHGGSALHAEPVDSAPAQSYGRYTRTPRLSLSMRSSSWTPPSSMWPPNS